MRRTIKALFPILLVAILSLGGCALLKLNVAAAVGTWTGTWNNTTYSSTGSAAMTVTQDESAKTVTMLLDLGGPDSVFTMGDPAATALTGSYTDTSLTVDSTVAFYGATTVTVNATGDVSGAFHPAAFDHVTFAGSQTTSTINLTYKVYDTPTHVYADGTVVMNKQ